MGCYVNRMITKKNSERSTIKKNTKLVKRNKQPCRKFMLMKKPFIIERNLQFYKYNFPE